MKNYKLIVATAIIAMGFYSCTKDNAPDGGDQPTELLAYRAIVLDANLNLSSSATYLWTLDEAPSDIYSLTNATSSKATFIASKAGDYKLKLTAKNGDITSIYKQTVRVEEPAKALSPYIAKVYDFMPAPGQATNNLPQYAIGDTKAEMIAKAQKSIVGEASGGLISLGGFGGYIVFGFDHTIVNVDGRRDMRIMGNAFYSEADPNPEGNTKGGSCEPGIIMVAYDANKNGTPDEDEWYEIAGSEYHKTTTIKGYEIKYHRPASEDKIVEDSWVAIENYIRWEDNQGKSGYKVKNSFHNQSYYPSWITEDIATLKGTLLPNNAIDQSGEGSMWVLYAYGHGYADNAKNDEDDSAIDISWAVDSKGERVELPGVDFVKVYTGINQEAGWLGEVSTEVSGAYDLHLRGENINTIK